MADELDGLPEGTDRVIAGAAMTEREGDLIVAEPKTTTGTQDGSTGDGVMGKVRSGGQKLSGQAADKARGFVGQGLERGSTTLASISRLVGDTATGIDEQLGASYGDYARSAADKINQVATSLGEKNPDELIEDTRDFVRKSPGVALAGAAVLGFALVRLVKSGLDAGSGDSGRTSRSKREG